MPSWVFSRQKQSQAKARIRFLRMDKSIESEARLGRRCPRLNVATAEAAELVDEFEIVVPTGFSPPNLRANRMPKLVSRSLVKARVLTIQTEIIQVDVSPRQP